MIGHAALKLAHPRRELKRVTLKEFIRWAYSVQAVDTMTGKTVHAHDAAEIHETSRDGIAELGGFANNWVQPGGGRTKWHPGMDVHPDAETLHDVVLSLGMIEAELVIRFGYTGQHPEPMVSIPRPSPWSYGVVGDRQDESRYQAAPDRMGQSAALRMRYRIRVVDVITESVRVYRNGGRKGMRYSHTEKRRTEVEVCPIFWWPDPAFVAAANGIAARWDQMLATIESGLQERALVSHEIVGDAQ